MKMQTWLIFLTSMCTTLEQWLIYLWLLFFQLCLTLWPHRLQHIRFPCPSLSPELGQIHVHWVGDATQPAPSLSSLLLLPSICPASGSFPKSQVFTSGGQRIGALVSASVPPANIQEWFPLGLTGLIFQSKEFSRVFSNNTVSKHQFFGVQASLWSNSQTCEKPELWLYRPLSAKWCLCFLIYYLGL